MAPGKTAIVIPILIIGIGVAWLLNTLEVIGGIDWIWTLGLALVGILTLVAAGLNRLSFVAGLFLIVASILSILRQTGRLRLEIEVPILVIVLGLLMLAGHLLRLPVPQWLTDPPPNAS